MSTLSDEQLKAYAAGYPVAPGYGTDNGYTNGSGYTNGNGYGTDNGYSAPNGYGTAGYGEAAQGQYGTGRYRELTSGTQAGSGSYSDHGQAPEWEPRGPQDQR